MVDARGNPVSFFLTVGEAHDLVGADRLLPTMQADILIADKAYDAVCGAQAAAEDQRVLAERECARIQERIATLQLLRDTVGDCLAQGRERYYEPVRRHLRPYLNDLFPRAELGDKFTITGMKRTHSESFWRLSGGTQEQIAVLVRLAMGTILAKRGGNGPIILDDALVYCDDGLVRINDRLTHAERPGIPDAAAAPCLMRYSSTLAIFRKNCRRYYIPASS